MLIGFFETTSKSLCKIGCKIELKFFVSPCDLFGNLMQKSFIPIGSHLDIHLMMSKELKLVFNHLP